MKIRNKKTGEIIEVQPNQLGDYGIFKKGGSFRDQLLQQNKPIIDANKSIVNKLLQQPQIDQVKKQEALARQIANYDRTFSQTLHPTPASKLKSKQLKASYVYNNPYSKLDENGNIIPIANDRDLQGVPKFGTQAYRTDDGINNIMHGLDAAMIIEGIGHLGYNGLRNLGNYVTSQTPLKNIYKLNPYAFKPNSEAYYRGIGRSGLDDAFDNRILRTANKTGDYKKDLYMTSNFNVAKGNYSQDRGYGVGSPFSDDWKMIQPKDPKSYIAEIPKSSVPNIRQVNNGEIFINKGSVPIKDVKFYKEHWLKGYKEVPKPKNNFTPSKVINSNHITTKNMAFPIYANGYKLYPNTGNYIFPSKSVLEIPAFQFGRNKQ